MGGLGSTELMIVLAIVVLLFGSAKLPQLARSLGQAKAELHRGEREQRDAPDDDHDLAA